MECNFEHTKKYIRKITINVLENDLPKNIVLNVNIPRFNKKGIRELKFVVKQMLTGLRNLIKESIQWDKKYYSVNW